MKKWLITLWILNLIDAVSTHLAILTGFAKEANPLMRWAYDIHPAVFFLEKMGLCSLAVWSLWRNGHQKSSRRIIVGLTVLYMLVVVWHSVFWFAYVTVFRHLQALGL